MSRLILSFLLIAMVAWPRGLMAQETASPRFVVHLLAYIRADYGGAVDKGKILSQFEYDEQREFVKSAIETAGAIEALRNDDAVMKDLAEMSRLVDSKGEASKVAFLATRIEQRILSVTGIDVAPGRWPDIAHGKALFDQQCARCHGATGHGDGPSGTDLEPKPTNFHDPKMDGIPPFQAFNTIRLGVPGTGMAAFTELSDREVWDLSFYILSLRHGGIPSGGGAKGSPPEGLTLGQIATSSDETLRAKLPGTDAEKAAALARIRTHVAAVDASKEPLRPAKDALLEAQRLAEQGAWDMARQTSVMAYLDGFEPVEPRLRAKDSDLVIELEEKMASVRSAISERSSLEVIKARVTETIEALGRAETVLQRKEVSTSFTFSVAFGIVLREAFEAVLILITLLGVIRSIGSKRAALFVHGGWMLAVGVGLVAWFFSGWLVAISGAQREILEGSISLFAVIVLLYFGFWLHRHTEIGKWRAFISEMVTTAVKEKNLYILGGISFMAVFREAFETVLFLRALLVEAGSHQELAVGAGVVSAFVTVFILASLLLRFSIKVPVRQLFAVSSFVMVALAFILIGKAARAFQETGWLSITSIPFRFHSDLIGLYPTYETLVPQLLVLGLSLGVWWWGRRSVRLAQRTA